jgi:cytochrome c-type biogenesis protein CcsB
MSSIALNEDLSQLSLFIIFGSMAVFTLSFLASVFHLARAASEKKAVSDKAAVLERVGLALAILATVILAVGVVLRGIAAVRVPWANLYEYSITGTLFLMLIFLTSLKIKEVKILASFVTGFSLLVLGTAVSVFYVEVKSLMPALQSYWLVIHVVVALLATAFFSIAATLSVGYLLKAANWVETPKTKGAENFKRVMGIFPTKEKLEQFAYRFNIVGFILWSFTLIAGAIWAERAWHRFWGWDTKEVWTFIIWTIYAGYLHANATRGWTGKRAVWLGLIGFLAVIFNFTIVNMFFKGLHVYSGL